MCDRACQFDVTHTLTTHRRERDLDTAFLADHTPMLVALVLATEALIVLHGAEQLRAK